MSDAHTDDAGHSNNSQQTQSIGDMLDLGIGADEWPHDFDWSEDSDQVYREHDGEERSVAFDILWDETGTFPPSIDDDVVYAILDDTDHKYRITVSGRDPETTTVGATGIALMAYLDPDASVEVVGE